MLADYKAVIQQHRMLVLTEGGMARGGAVKIEGDKISDLWVTGDLDALRKQLSAADQGTRRPT
jgi:hypothetical protein